MTTTSELEARLDKLLATAQAEVADTDLFAPLIEREECPICLLPLPILNNESLYMTCCGKRICEGCFYVSYTTAMKEGVPKHKLKCPFCRQITSKINDIKALKKLMNNNHSTAFLQMADRYESGSGVVQSDTKKLEMYIRAAELGDKEAYWKISSHYHGGIIFEEEGYNEEDMSKWLMWNEISARKGSVTAHKMLAIAYKNDNIDRSIQHWKVLAEAGDQDAMNKLMKAYKDHHLSKTDLAKTLRAFQKSNDQMKSKDRSDRKDK